MKTLTQFCDEIHYVSFVIGTEPLMAKDGTLLMMRGKDFVNSISGSMEYVREDYVTLYFCQRRRNEASGRRCHCQIPESDQSGNGGCQQPDLRAFQ